MNLILSVTILIIMFFISIVVLKVLFKAAIFLIGWIGGMIVAAIPGVFTFIITHALFGFDSGEATLQAIITTLIIGVAVNLMGFSGHEN